MFKQLSMINYNSNVKMLHFLINRLKRDIFTFNYTGIKTLRLLTL